MQLSVANAPTSWGVEDAADRDNPPWTKVLDDIAESGYQGVELGPLGYMPEKEFLLRRELELRRLELVAGYLFEPLHEPAAAEAVAALAHRTCRLLAAADATCLVIIQGFTPDRESTAGRPEVAERADAGAWDQLIRSVHEVARAAREVHGLTACFHPHAGTYVEFEDEIDGLMSDTDPDLVDLCIDTGHSAYAGIDPVDLYRRYADRVTYLHLKDVDGGVLAEATTRGWSFDRAVGEGVFCPIGQGLVDFGALGGALSRHGFRGWATVEQDRLGRASRSPADDAHLSLERLSALGLAGGGG